MLKKSKFEGYPKIEDLRKTLLQDNNEIKMSDYGAGSRRNATNSRKINEIAKNASIDKKYGQLLAKIVAHYNLEQILELGTSLGIGTAYLAANAKQITTVEGDNSIHEIAQKNMENLAFKNVQPICATFDDYFKFNSEEELKKFDLIYIDGNHTYEASMKYFNHLIKAVNNETFLVFDDIRWSAGMEKAWQEIIVSPEINVSIELMRMGIVIKRKEQEKQHFILRF